jgi:hypothetical protein
MEKISNLNGAADHGPANDSITDEFQLEKQNLPFTLDDLAEEDDDFIITADNILKNTKVRKPGSQEFFRTHPELQRSQRVVIIKNGFKEIVYLVHKNLLPPSKSLEQDSVVVQLTVCINRKGELFIWVNKKSKKDGDPSKHYSDALQSIQAARTKWIRHFWLEDENRHTRRIGDNIPDIPAWPEGTTLQDILIAGFGDRIITSENHRVLKELRGEIDGPVE